MAGLKAVAGGLTSLNGLSGPLSLTSAGGTIVITPMGSTINLETSGGGGGTIGGSIAATQVAFGSGANTITGSADFIYDGTYLALASGKAFKGQYTNTLGSAFINPDGSAVFGGGGLVITNAGGLTATSITNSALTSGRVVLSGAGGAETDQAGITYSGNTLILGVAGSSAGQLRFNQASGIQTTTITTPTTGSASTITLPNATSTLATLALSETLTNKTGTSATNTWFNLTTTGTSGAATYTSNTLNIPQYQAAGTYVTSVSGTAGRITSSGGTTPVIDIDAAYVGQASITTLGTITTGVWNGTTIGTGFGGTGTTTTFTQGSIIFAGTSGIYTQDNANFFFDDANNRLGLLTATPTHDFTLGTGADRTIKMQDSATGAGNRLTILGSNGFTGGNPGGRLTFTGGNATAATTSGNFNNINPGGALDFITGAGGDSTIAGTTNRGAQGGAATFSGGTGGTASNATTSCIGGTGGSFNMNAGSGGATGTNTAATARGGPGGSIGFSSGAGGSGATGPSDGGASGALAFTVNTSGGAGTGRVGGAGGLISLTGSAGGSSTLGSTTGNTGGAGSAITMNAGNGGAATTAGAVAVTSGAGGSFALVAGNGGLVTGSGGTNTAGDAGTLSFTSGNGGVTAGTGTPVGKDGGAINFTAGDGTSTVGATNNGGAIYLLGGAKSPSGTDGNILLGINSGGTARGLIGVGQSASLTALLDIAASTTTRSSMRIRSGTAPTSPNDGDIWYDGVLLRTRVNSVTSPIGSIVASSSLTAQSAAIGATTIYAVPANGAGFYRISWVATVTTPGTTSTLGGATGLQVRFTKGAVVKTTTPQSVTNFTSITNTTAAACTGVFCGYCDASTNLQYLFGYTSTGTVMQYSLDIKAEYLGA